MNKKIFIEVMREMWGSEIDLPEAWSTYEETMMTLEIGKQMDQMVLEALPKMSPDKRLRWRTSLAEQGIEMTPIQVDQYISIIELALGI
jgi:hypothetical protein